MSESNIYQNKKAIVIGASMAGLLTARVLSDRFDRVILIERDIFPAPGENRKGVPQGKHTHVLLERGHRIMESFFPGLTDELAQQGAALIEDVGTDVRWIQGDAYLQPGASGISGVGVSRPTLEWLIRKRVLALPNVKAIQDCSVSELVTVEANGSSRVTGVRFVNRQNGRKEESMNADLIVDASGRGSRSPVWLEDMGYEQPEDEEIKIGVGYTTCIYRRKSGQLSGLKGITIMASPPSKRLGVMLAQDGKRWVLTLGGYLGEHAPSDYPGFLEFARSLPAPHIYNVIKDAELLREPVAFTFPANLRRHYEKLNRFPEGYLVIGDALCSFNPIYGQGMTVAAMEAKALENCLADGGSQLARRFFARASQIIDVSWNAAVGNDLKSPEIEGPRTPMLRILNWYLDKLQLAAHHDAVLSAAFLKVINMVAPPPSILNPRIVWRVLKGNLWPVQQKLQTQESSVKTG